MENTVAFENEFLAQTKSFLEETFFLWGELETYKEKKNSVCWTKYLCYCPHGDSALLELTKVAGNQVSDKKFSGCKKVLKAMNSLDSIIKCYYYDNSEDLEELSDDEFLDNYLNNRLSDEVMDSLDNYITTYYDDAPYWVIPNALIDKEKKTMEFFLYINDDAGYHRNSVPSWAGKSADGSDIGNHIAYDKTVPMTGEDDKDLMIFSNELGKMLSVIK